MIPHQQLPTDPFTLTACGGVLAAAVEKIPHKILLSIASALLMVMMYWGFTRTFATQDQQVFTQSETRKEMVAAFVEVNKKLDAQREKDHVQDLCLQETKQAVEEIKSVIKNAHPKLNGLPGGK